MAIIFDYFDHWEAELTCPNCGWKGALDPKHVNERSSALRVCVGMGQWTDRPSLRAIRINLWRVVASP